MACRPNTQAARAIGLGLLLAICPVRTGAQPQTEERATFCSPKLVTGAAGSDMQVSADTHSSYCLLTGYRWRNSYLASAYRLAGVSYGRPSQHCLNAWPFSKMKYIIRPQNVDCLGSSRLVNTITERKARP